jgi:hypothetical protein
MPSVAAPAARRAATESGLRLDFQYVFAGEIKPDERLGFLGLAGLSG